MKRFLMTFEWTEWWWVVDIWRYGVPDLWSIMGRLKARHLMK